MSSEYINETEGASAEDTAGATASGTAAEPEVIEPEVVYAPEPEEPAGSAAELVGEPGEELVEPEVVYSPEPAVVYSPEPAETPARGKSPKRLIAVIVAILLAAAGGAAWYFNSDAYAIRRMEKEAAQALEQGDYKTAITTYSRLYGIEGHKDTAVEGLKQAISLSVDQELSQGNAEPAAMFDFWDGIASSVPELKDFAEQKIADTALLCVEQYSDDVFMLNALYKITLERYYDSDLICETIDGAVRPAVGDAVRLALEDLAGSGFAKAAIDGEFDRVFELLKASNIRSICHTASAYIDFPVRIELGQDFGNMSFGFHYDNDLPALYVGGYDSAGKRSGEGILIYEATDKNDSDMFEQSFIRGTYADDEINGPFEGEFLTVKNSRRRGRMEGSMKHDLIDGEMTVYMTDTALSGGADYIYDLLFNFDEG